MDACDIDQYTHFLFLITKISFLSLLPSEARRVAAIERIRACLRYMDACDIDPNRVTYNVLVAFYVRNCK
jgi:hypothetical protein